MAPLPPLSVDLVGQAIEVLKLLHMVDTLPFGGLYDETFATEAVRRYEQCWLPLAAAVTAVSPGILLVPPPDVAYVWLIHRMHAEDYERDCRQRFGFAPVHPAYELSFAFTDSNDSETAPIRLEWGYFYGCDEPFWPPRLHEYPQSKFYSRASIDLVGKLGVARETIQQVLRSNYLDRDFLTAASIRYRRILQIASVYHACGKEDLPLVVPPDVALLWQAHAGTSCIFRADLENMGLPPVVLGTCGEEFSLDFKATAAAYEAAFHQPFIVTGTEHVPASELHPAEVTLPGVSVLYGSPEVQRAGAHALYALWLLEKGFCKSQVLGKLLGRSCHRWAALRYLTRKAQAWTAWHNLPHSWRHPYWAAFRLTCGRSQAAATRLKKPLSKPIALTTSTTSSPNTSHHGNHNCSQRKNQPKTPEPSPSRLHKTGEPPAASSPPNPFSCYLPTFAPKDILTPAPPTVAPNLTASGELKLSNSLSNVCGMRQLITSLRASSSTRRRQAVADSSCAPSTPPAHPRPQCPPSRFHTRAKDSIQDWELCFWEDQLHEEELKQVEELMHKVYLTPPISGVPMDVSSLPPFNPPKRPRKSEAEVLAEQWERGPSATAASERVGSFSPSDLDYLPGRHVCTDWLVHSSAQTSGQLSYASFELAPDSLSLASSLVPDEGVRLALEKQGRLAKRSSFYTVLEHAAARDAAA